MAMMDDAPKKKRRRKASEDENVVVQLHDETPAPSMLPSGAMEIPTEDGGVVINFNPQIDSANDADEGHFENLAMQMDSGELHKIAEELLEGIATDDQSRSEWLAIRAKGMDLLGIKLRDARGGTSMAPVEGMSVVQHPLLLETVLRFQADARGELLPAAGPVKVRVDGNETNDADSLARKLEKAMNRYLTVTDRNYYPDTDQMLFKVGFGGVGFKKVYHSPLLNRPVSETVDAEDIIVSNAAINLRSAARVTQKIDMRKSVMKRMQILGLYRDIPIEDAQPEPNAVERKKDELQGVTPSSRPEDQNHTIYECYCELDLKGYEHKDEKGKVTGLPLPYRVTIDKESREVLEIRRNWKEDDEDYCARCYFVKYSFVDAFGFWPIGLLHILGSTTNALTAGWREILDAGMFGNFPGFLFASDAGGGLKRNNTNQFRIAPGSGMGMSTGGQPIQNVIMPLPYKEAGPGLMSFVSNMEQVGLRVGGASQTSVAEGKQEAPVGTTLALIEQASKVMSAVHKRLHAAQAEEFGMLRDLLCEDPDALWRGDKKPANMNAQEVVQALEMYDLTPCADPNTPSQMHRLMKAQAIKMIAQQNPQMYDMKKVDRRVMLMADVGDPEGMFAPPMPQPGPDPMTVAALQLKGRDQEFKEKKALVDAQLKAKELDVKQNLGVMQIASRLATHPEANNTVDTQLAQMSAFLTPNKGQPQ